LGFFYLLLMNSIYAKWFGFAFEKGNLNTFCEGSCIFHSINGEKRFFSNNW